MNQTDVIKATSEQDRDWYRRGTQDLRLSDAIDASSGASMTVGFARYGAGESNPWTMTYDEALVVTRGRFSVESGGATTTAGPGEVIYLHKGTDLVYRAEEDTELVYVSHPHWMEATAASPFAARIDEFQLDPQHPETR
jgi:ethanolamine utilization protein EutQ